MDRDKFLEVDLSADSRNKERRFIEWLAENGANFADTVELRAYDEEVRGVHAAKAIVEDDIVIEVPLKCLVTVEMGKETAPGRAVIEAGLELDAPKHVFLMLFILLDRKEPNSFFKPYYDLLPATLSNMPVFWNDEELSLLKGSPLLQQIEERKSAIKADYEAICGAWPPFSYVCTCDEFQWARMCVCSRNFGIVVDGVRTSAMVPYADMLNHLRPRETKWAFDNARRAFTITALQSISVGAQIYDSYGQKCNHRFLLNYGFSVENNAEPDGFCPDEVVLELELDESGDTLAARKRLLWMRDGANSTTKRVRVCASDNENWRSALSLLRVLVADEEDLELVLGQNPYGSYRTASDVHFPVSLRNEIAALEKLRSLCRGLTSRYARPLSEDIAELQRGDTLPAFSNVRHAIIHVAAEKKVLAHYTELSEVAISAAKLASREAFDSEVSRIFDEPRYRHVAGYCNQQLRHARRLNTDQQRIATPPPVQAAPTTTTRGVLATLRGAVPCISTRPTNVTIDDDDDDDDPDDSIQH